MKKRWTYIKAFVLFEGGILLLKLFAKHFPDYNVYSNEMFSMAVGVLAIVAGSHCLNSIIFRYLNDTKLAQYQQNCFTTGAWLVMFDAAALTLTENSILRIIEALLFAIGIILVVASIVLSLCNVLRGENIEQLKETDSNELKEVTQ